MKKILRIDASARRPSSLSRKMGDHLIQGIFTRDAQVTVVHRDIGQVPVPHIQQATIDGFYRHPKAMTADDRHATSLSDLLIAELQYADTLLVTTPFYNFGVPSTLKAWLDQVVRFSKTYSFEAGSYKGLVRAEHAFVCISDGSLSHDDNPAGFTEGLMESYLDQLLRFIGISKVHFVKGGSTRIGDDMVATDFLAAQAEIDAMLARIFPNSLRT